PRVTGGEIVLAENARMQIRIYELQQQIRALNADRDELVQENTRLRNRNQEFETDNNQIRVRNENLTRLNDALKIVLRDAEDEKDHYKAANIKEFEDFISNYIFGLFNNIGTLLRFDNQYITNILDRDYDLQKYKELITENVDKKIIRYIVFQYEYTKTSKKHVQGFCMLWTQMRLGNYKYRKKASTIKSIFQDEEMHVDFHNGTFEDVIRYCKKDKNRCSKHHPYCREGFNQHLEKQKKIRKQTIEDIKEQIKPINEIVIDAFVNSGTAPHIIKELYNTICDNYLTQILFPDAYHKSQNDGIWFQGYDENKVFVFDDFYNHNMEFSTLLTLIDNKPHTVQKKGGHLNFCSFVNVFISNISLRNQYVYFENTQYFGNETVKIENKRKYSSIYNRFDYIIEYKKFRNNDKRPCDFECLCCSVKRIFHKGLYENFINLRFDIEFNSD
ncbi:993_t:CDS:2, partial [Racocetra persica]